MATVRAKFYCSETIRSGWTEAGTPKVSPGVTYKFRAVYSNDPNHENKKFWDATPTADFSMTINNPGAQIFEVGREYYLDFTPAS